MFASYGRQPVGLAGIDSCEFILSVEGKRNEEKLGQRNKNGSLCKEMMDGDAFLL
jgi:hypothetical protein